MVDVQQAQVVVIEWTDAAIHGSAVLTRAETADCGLVAGVACGMLIHEDTERITIAMDWFPEHDTFRVVSSYPQSGVRKVTRLEWMPVPTEVPV